MNGREQTVRHSKKTFRLNCSGFTLIEVMIAFVIILIVMLGLLNLTAQVVAVNVKNTVRDEAIKVAEEVIEQERAKPFEDIKSGQKTIKRNLRNFSIPYTVTINVPATPSTDAKIINVTVTWQYRGTNYNHTISSLIRRTE